MTRKLWYIPLLVIPTVIGLIHGFVILSSTNVFLSWFLIGLWLCCTFYFFRTLKSYHEFGAPHNTSLFILGPLFVGIFYCFWGYYTGLLGWNLFGSVEVYFSLWVVLFAVPYLIRGTWALYSCFRRYDVVYLGQKRINARKFGIFATTISLLTEIVIILFFLVYDYADSALQSIHLYPDFILLMMSFFSIYLIIRYGFFGRQPSLTEISLTAARRRKRTEPITPSRSPSRSSSSGSSSRSSTSRASSRTSSRSSSPSSSTRTTSRSSSTRSTSRTAQSTTRSRSATTSKSSSSRSRSSSRATTAPRTKTKEAGKSKIKELVRKCKPKAGTISLEDFKCIFCFQLPKFPEDKGRGIILCPKCKHPAHGDEFREWLRNSTLCSRCDAPIPARFRRTPEIIPVKQYTAVIKYYTKKAK